MLRIFILQLLKIAPELFDVVMQAIDGLSEYWSPEAVQELKDSIPNDGHKQTDAEIDSRIDKEFPDLNLGEGHLEVPDDSSEEVEEPSAKKKGKKNG